MQTNLFSLEGLTFHDGCDTTFVWLAHWTYSKKDAKRQIHDERIDLKRKSLKRAVFIGILHRLSSFKDCVTTTGMKDIQPLKELNRGFVYVCSSLQDFYKTVTKKFLAVFKVLCAHVCIYTYILLYTYVYIYINTLKPAVSLTKFCNFISLTSCLCRKSSSYLHFQRTSLLLNSCTA